MEEDVQNRITDILVVKKGLGGSYYLELPSLIDWKEEERNHGLYHR